MDYSTYYLEALAQIKETHDALLKRDFQKAYDHCLNASAEIRLMSTNIKSWLPTEEK